MNDRTGADRYRRAGADQAHGLTGDAAPHLAAHLAAHLANARPKAIAALARHFRDIDLAEDAFQEAAARAVVNWRENGLPRDPSAWLIFTGRNIVVDRIRQERRHADYLARSVEEPVIDLEGDLADRIDMDELRDDVLRLLFMCCQADLSVSDQLALALKVVGGFSVPQIAHALLVKPKAMEQRITRAKKKAAAIAADLDPPSMQERARRLNAVTLMIYLMFNEGYSATAGAGHHIQVELCDEAIRLARLLLSLFPAQPELMGLLALCLIQHSRRAARMDNLGNLIPLDEQDRSMWDRQSIAEGRVLIEKALRRGRPGPYQIQAAIADVHSLAARAEDTDWAEIERLYRALEAVQPSPVVTLNRAVALSKTDGAQAALDLLDTVGDALSTYLYFQTSRAAMLCEIGRREDARAAYMLALDLGPGDAEAAYIRTRLDALS